MADDSDPGGKGYGGGDLGDRAGRASEGSAMSSPAAPGANFASGLGTFGDEERLGSAMGPFRGWTTPMPTISGWASTPIGLLASLINPFAGILAKIGMSGYNAYAKAQNAKGSQPVGAGRSGWGVGGPGSSRAPGDGGSVLDNWAGATQTAPTVPLALTPQQRQLLMNWTGT